MQHRWRVHRRADCRPLRIAAGRRHRPGAVVTLIFLLQGGRMALAVDAHATRPDAFRARQGIKVPFWPPMHPAGLRCSSLTYARYARSSRLAGRAGSPARQPRWGPRAPRRPEWHTYSWTFLDGSLL